MIKVTFHNHNEFPDNEFKFAVIVAKYIGKWIFCRHKERTSWEIPGGYREIDEAIQETARRELIEETGATKFDISPLTVYCVENGGEKTYGMLFFAEITELGALPDGSEIGEISLFDSIPDELTYPKIQPFLFEFALKTAAKCYSYVMGTDDSVLSLKEQGFDVKSDGANYTVSFPEYKSTLWEDFIAKHLQLEFWNEYLTNGKVVFIFHLQDGIKRFEVENYENDEVLHLCEKLCDCKFESIKSMLWGNWFYKEVLEQ